MFYSSAKAHLLHYIVTVDGMSVWDCNDERTWRVSVGLICKNTHPAFLFIFLTHVFLCASRNVNHTAVGLFILHAVELFLQINLSFTVNKHANAADSHSFQTHTYAVNLARHAAAAQEI